jgi:hypothetical protein
MAFDVIYFDSEGRLHRDDGPAVEYVDGTKHWYQHGLLHRDGGPAVEHSNVCKCWYQHGELHRDDGPAVEYSDGTKYWYQNGIKLSEVVRRRATSLAASAAVSDWKKMAFDFCAFWHLSTMYLVLSAKRRNEIHRTSTLSC